MALKGILEKESENIDSIHVYLEEGEWNAYEYSAYLLVNCLPEIVARYLFFPENSIETQPEKCYLDGVIVATVPFDQMLKSFGMQVITVGDDYFQIRLDKPCNRLDFLIWKKHLPVM